MQNLAQPQNINNNQRKEIVSNGGVNVHSSGIGMMKRAPLVCFL